MSEPRGPGRIPIGDARTIARTRGVPLIVMFAIDADGQQFHITTYGMNKKLCKLAADFGRQFAEVIFDGRVQPSQTEPDDLPEVPTMWEQQQQMPERPR